MTPKVFDSDSSGSRSELQTDTMLILTLSFSLKPGGIPKAAQFAALSGSSLTLSASQVSLILAKPGDCGENASVIFGARTASLREARNVRSWMGYKSTQRSRSQPNRRESNQTNGTPFPDPVVQRTCNRPGAGAAVPRRTPRHHSHPTRRALWHSAGTLSW